MIPFILANFVAIMLCCVLAFVVGLIMRFAGKSRQRRGEREFRAILGSWTEDEREAFFVEHGHRDLW